MTPADGPSGPVVVGYDGSESSERALRDAAALLKPRRALVVVVWKEDIALRAIDPPEHLPPAALDIRTAQEVEQSMAERAQRLAQHGAEIAREGGLDAEGLAIAEEVSVTIAEVLVDIAERRDAAAIVVGGHGHGGTIGPISRDVIRTARRPVLVRGPAR